ncbi:hypothetical protein [Martelella alba]|uniref:Uncharacterized protein n=1 Tax=Martelella alba TaxID=2590451 RepID=A0ABY2SH76_9HYPH|nr:hypothetical protein [Martelella alba]TKI04374.1 hypothetical protein FCN80_18005 [Martelella alba]
MSEDPKSERAVLGDTYNVIDTKDQYGFIIIGHTELKMYSLDTLLEGISAVNLHQKISFGLPTGKEQL